MPVSFVTLVPRKLLLLNPLKARRRAIARLPWKAIENLNRGDRRVRKTKVSLLSLPLTVNAKNPLLAFTVLTLTEGGCFKVDVPVGCAAVTLTLLPLTVLAAEGCGFAAVALFFIFQLRKDEF